MRTCGTGSLLVLLAALDVSAAPPAATERLRGVVHAPDGPPAAGVVVWAAKQTEFEPLERRETTTDANGRYALDLEPGDWLVWARRGTQGGEGPARNVPVQIVAGEEPEAVVIRLEERGTLRGRLLAAETGKPIPGGRLFLDAGLVLTADADGRFEIGGLHRGSHELVVVAPGRQREYVHFDTTARASTELDIPVPKSARIVGRVIDSAAKPLTGAWVGQCAYSSTFALKGLLQTCDVEGRFEYASSDPADQRTWLAAGARGHGLEVQDDLLVPAGDRPLEVNFCLGPLDSLLPGDRLFGEKGRVVSGSVRWPDGKPAARVLLSWPLNRIQGMIDTRTDTEGRFRFTVPDEDRTLAVLPRGFLPEFVAVAEGGDQKLEVKLRGGGHTVRGRVLDDLGNPIKDVLVIPHPQPPGDRDELYTVAELTVRTNAEGKFEVKGVPDRVRFNFIKVGLAGVFQDLDPNKAENIVTLQYGGRCSGALVGQAVDRNGKPIRNFRVLVRTPREHQQGDKINGYFGSGVRFTSDDGSFILTGDVVAGCVYRIKVIAEGHGEAVVDRATAVALNRVRIAEPVTVRAGPPVALRVRAVTTTGKPIADARVTLVNGEPGLDSAFTWGVDDGGREEMALVRTDANGWAGFPSLSFTGATVLVHAQGYARQRVGWRDGQKELTVQMAPEAVIVGSLRNATSQPAKIDTVNLVCGRDAIWRVAVDRKGCFRVAELPAGTWTIQGGGLNEERVVVTPGQTKEVEIRIPEP
jgi:hypothetical protein